MTIPLKTPVGELLLDLLPAIVFFQLTPLSDTYPREMIRACLKTHHSGTTSTKSWQKPKKQSSKSFEKV
ncbi:hypothetical protein, partial [Paenibacillus tianmuensis]|uniref:hypothetical protein n=1 Tax=Paenibacillus tianmuensis TaxID=624147 RepID=UPI001C277CB9